MIKLERASVMNLENAMRGARNPMNSWARSDSYYNEAGDYVLGPNDLDLARRLRKAGSDHRKFLRLCRQLCGKRVQSEVMPGFFRDHLIGDPVLIRK